MKYEKNNIPVEDRIKFDDLTKEQQINVKIDTYKYWLDNIDSTFGVVKTDHQGNFGTYNRMTYQLLNSFPNLKYAGIFFRFIT